MTGSYSESRKYRAAGRRMRDYGDFDVEGAAKAALLIECGQHWERLAGDLAKESAARFLVAAATPQKEEGEEDRLCARAFPSDSISMLHPPHPPVAKWVNPLEFVFAREFLGGEVLPEAGTLLGHDGDREVVTPRPDMMLVMPSKRLWKGQTAVRLAVRDG